MSEKEKSQGQASLDSEYYKPLINLAREAIAAHLKKINFQAPTDQPCFNEPSQGVFVTLYSPGKRLRGCIGHLGPIHEKLAEEIADCAVSSAVRDSRFPMMTLPELDSLTIELSLLFPAELVESMQELDPKKYGVIVSSGYKRGVLLPEVVDTVEEQVDIARQKAGIARGEPLKIERFLVTKVR